LSETQSQLIGEYERFYDSSVQDLLSDAGIGYVSEDGSEVFKAWLDEGNLVVSGDESAHIKFKFF